MDHYWKMRAFQVLRLLFVLAIIYLSIKVLQFVTPLIYPFILGFIIAIMINRPVNWIQKRANIPRWISVSIVLVIVILLVLGSITLLITQVVIEIGHLITVMPLYIQDAVNYLKHLITKEIITNFYDRIQLLYSSLDESYKTTIEENIGAALSKIAQTGTYLVNSFLKGLQSFLTSLPNTATVLVISTLASFFISKDFYKMKHKISSLVPPAVKDRSVRVLSDLKSALFGFVKAQFTLVSITGFIIIIGLLILRVDYAFTIGIIAGILDLLPLLGTGSVFVPWIIYLFIKQDFQLVIGLSILYAVVVVQRQIMEPKVVADNIGLDPLITLIALFVGLQLFGVIGLIIGPVAVVIINALMNAGVLRDIWTFIIGEQKA
ncbi:sporulation integral membrane protein YtvI [Ammoniphilus resinae]|uniref:Sporulation integral membrane protein YtvI n=1 Tax=Ammoniphilus resinae TaxID=861532 RepID=A0ABS4GJ74_9BACL|nr:sporulation integral membrane protein YtvI [Ammoniphilus resinae]MBP1930305.1 sporulation integral membrane protein YtvI [Ammoniphilus resinae]